MTLAAVVGAGELGLSCTAKNVIVDVPIGVYVPASCGDGLGARVTYTGLGDFQPMSAPTETAALGSKGFSLTALPAATREVVMGPVGDGAPWAGAAAVPDRGNLTLLALPMDRACSLSREVNLGGVGGTAIGMIDPAHALVVGGEIPPFIADLGTGIVTQLPSTAATPFRAYATVTPFGSGALVAGGVDTTTLEALGNAVVYTPGPGGAVGTFGAPINLPANQRKKHGAVVLADGRTLLVGGVSDLGTLVATIEALDPTQPTNVRAVATLVVPRVLPTVLLLPTGQIFIGGGFGRDGSPVTTIEWLSADLSPAGTIDLCQAGTVQGFAPTEEGAVLAVMGPEAGSATCSNVHLVRPFVAEEAPILDPPPTRIQMFTGPEGSPVILTDRAALRWNPWTTTFTSLGAHAAGMSTPTTASVSASPGLALWLGEDSHLWALRFDTRGPFATDFDHPTYLDTDDLDTAPDRIPSDAGVTFSVRQGARLAAGATVFLTDATYETVTASVALPQGGEVVFVLRDVNGHELTCATSDVPPGGVAELSRNGGVVAAGMATRAPVPCTGSLDASVRVAIGLRGPAGGASIVRALTVMRGTP